MSTILSLNNISVKYGENTILENINLDIPLGKFIGLMGDNGSGKTTLLKLLAGEITPANGSTYFLDNDISLNAIAKRMSDGIIYIHQNPLVFPELKVWENFLIWQSALSAKAGLVDKKSVIDFLNQKLESLGFTLPLENVTSSLSETELQILEFCRFFLINAKLVLLDEATSILNYDLSNKILAYLKNFTLTGGSVIFISHRIEEVLKFSDETYVLTQKGLQSILANEAQKKQHAEPLLTSTTIGRALPRSGRALHIDCEADQTLIPINILLHEKEIFGITGLDGLAFETIAYRLRKCFEKLKGNGNKPFTMGKDFAFLGKNRATDWVFEGQTVGFNISVTKDKSWFASNDAKAIGEIIAHYRILPADQHKSVDELSGGNKLKTALARTLSIKSSIFILDEPFTGIDANSREVLIRIILEESQTTNCSFIIISKDYRELAKFCDSVLVIQNDGSSKLIYMEDALNFEEKIESYL